MNFLLQHVTNSFVPISSDVSAGMLHKTSIEPERLPSSARSPRRGQITWTLIAVNFVSFALMQVTARIWPNLDLLQWSTNWGPLSLNGQWWRLLTALFVHSSALHLVGNMILLCVVGQWAERFFARWTFLFFYFICGVAGSLAALFFHPEKVSQGASAAIFGLAGGLMSAYINKGVKKLTGREYFASFVLVFWMAADIYAGAGNSGIDTAAHVAGLTVGIVLGAALLSSSHSFRQSERLIFASFGVLLIATAIFVRHHNAYAVPLGVAELALDQGRTDDALRYLHTALRQNPRSFLANASAGEAYLRNGDYALAEVSVRKALQLDSENAYANYLLGTLEAYTGRCRDADSIAQTLSDRDEKSPFQQSLTKAASSCHLAATAEKYLSQGSVDVAINIYERALAEDPGNYQIYFSMSKAYRTQGMRKEAENMYAKGLVMQQLARLGSGLQCSAKRICSP